MFSKFLAQKEDGNEHYPHRTPLHKLFLYSEQMPQHQLVGIFAESPNHQSPMGLVRMQVR